MDSDSLKPGFSKNLFDLSGKVAVVTGGAGILGQYFCAALADHGASVAVVDQDPRRVDELAKLLSKTFGNPAVGYTLDVSEHSAIAPLIDRVEMELGSIDILHNNAATKGGELERFFEPTESYSPDTWREIMAVNLDGAFFMAQEVGGRMAKRGRGSIIQTASIYGIMGPDQRIYEGSEYMGREINTPAVYSASKAGIVGLSRYLATYWGSQGVRVNTLTPGGVSSGQNNMFEVRYNSRIPLGRMAMAEEMVGALIFLASDAARYVTGQNIIVDGGLEAW
ncbi:NAD(P)-dependent dehydrogenase, short-chain alcohol dehydrogenase family [Modicisalibacter ilicicola DSM 19980]|uniref:NAD(P)-dependent dehydrogenase, short-chain alcohol dehydrogenase family n=1 Tax=Modicisalibacter ilicicola DSM 19980 TaxID=1121942 RepID=A0A1M5ENR5_9GAMM|nr:SDR family oxidoreductase [Halomonas ilicicola]SHF80794.1 NAD(P)-dependent dehydrogenase, short-chain alcohol dehydrogenase family [Halomonas ilicicola DSM 19980]